MRILGVRRQGRRAGEDFCVEEGNDNAIVWCDSPVDSIQDIHIKETIHVILYYYTSRRGKFLSENIHFRLSAKARLWLFHWPWSNTCEETLGDFTTFKDQDHSISSIHIGGNIRGRHQGYNHVYKKMETFLFCTGLHLTAYDGRWKYLSWGNKSIRVCCSIKHRSAHTPHWSVFLLNWGWGLGWRRRRR